MTMAEVVGGSGASLPSSAAGPSGDTEAHAPAASTLAGGESKATTPVAPPSRVSHRRFLPAPRSPPGGPYAGCQALVPIDLSSHSSRSPAVVCPSALAVPGSQPVPLRPHLHPPRSAGPDTSLATASGASIGVAERNASAAAPADVGGADVTTGAAAAPDAKPPQADSKPPLSEANHTGVAAAPAPADPAVAESKPAARAAQGGWEGRPPRGGAEEEEIMKRRVFVGNMPRTVRGADRATPVVCTRCTGHPRNKRAACAPDPPPPHPPGVVHGGEADRGVDAKVRQAGVGQRDQGQGKRHLKGVRLCHLRDGSAGAEVYRVKVHDVHGAAAQLRPRQAQG